MVTKSWLKLLQPDIKVSGTILALSADTLLERDIKGIIFDVDDTLVPLRQPEVAPEVIAWWETIRSGFQVWLVSNNLDARRIREIGTSLNVPHINGAAKPSRRALRRAVESMQLPIHQVAIVGDRILTDVLAGNRLGIWTVLVDPLQR